MPHLVSHLVCLFAYCLLQALVDIILKSDPSAQETRKPGRCARLALLASAHSQNPVPCATACCCLLFGTLHAPTPARHS